jgi:hypothetical protein
MVYDGLKEWWARDIGPWERLGFGSIAGIAATITTYPRMAVSRLLMNMNNDMCGGGRGSYGG